MVREGLSKCETAIRSSLGHLTLALSVGKLPPNLDEAWSATKPMSQEDPRKKQEAEEPVETIQSDRTTTSLSSSLSAAAAAAKKKKKKEEEEKKTRARRQQQDSRRRRLERELDQVLLARMSTDRRFLLEMHSALMGSGSDSGRRSGSVAADRDCRGVVEEALQFIGERQKFWREVTPAQNETGKAIMA